MYNTDKTDVKPTDVDTKTMPILHNTTEKDNGICETADGMAEIKQDETLTKR